MLDIKLLRQNRKQIEHKLRSKQSDSDLTTVLTLDEQLRELKHASEQLKSKRNELSKQIGESKRLGQDTSDLMNEVNSFGLQLTELDTQLKQAEEQYTYALSLLVNIPMDDVIESPDPANNVCVLISGEKPSFTFPAKHHLELNERLHILDLKRGAKIAGTGWPVYVGHGAQLEWALLQYMVNHHINLGWNFILVPHCVRPEIVYGAGQLPKFAHQLFRLEDENPLYLIPTSEIPLTGLHYDEILESTHLPRRYVSYTPCFRREAGAAGGKERGLIRMHQFNKVEMYAITHPEKSEAMFEEMVESAAALVEGLGLHYRLMALVTGDLGAAAAKTIDVEVWLPGQDRYYEVSSVSNCTDYQARRSQIRFRHGTQKPEFVHTLNGSGLATSRLFVAILENYQQADGSVTIPPGPSSLYGGLRSPMPRLAQVDDILSDVTVILDVRTPSEYQRGHIPCALNLPLFSDSERAEVGLLYKKKGHRAAVLQGLDFMGPKLRSLVEMATAYARAKKAAIYCWRGGMRSQAISLLLRGIGFDIAILHDGYKAYRKWCHHQMAKSRRLILIGGPTGVGKTWTLQALRKLGEQVLDLEALAGHRGGTYGSLGLPPQPTQEHFENKVAYVLSSFDSRPIWVEDERRMIGSVKIPDALFEQMKASPLLVVDRPRDERVSTLMEEYGHLQLDDLVTATRRLGKHLGNQRMQQVLHHIQQGELQPVAEIILQYYDKAYAYHLKNRPHHLVNISDASSNPSTWAERLVRQYQDLEVNH